MASFKFDIQDNASADRWMARAEELNERVRQHVEEAGNLMKEFGSIAEGKVFTNVVDLSDAVITGATEIMRGMGQIMTGIKNALNKIKSKIMEMSEDVKNTKKNLYQK